MFKKIKPEIRVLAWDDGPFEKGKKAKVPLIGAIYRGGSFPDGFLSIEIDQDGSDATQKIAEATNRTKHKEQLRAIMLDGITFAGFNTVDITKLNKETNLPVIVITRKNTDFGKFRKAMKKLKGFKERWNNVEKAGKLINYKKIYFQKIGLTEKEAKKLLDLTTTRSYIPEPIRVAHLVASAIVRGESIGRA